MLGVNLLKVRTLLSEGNKLWFVDIALKIFEVVDLFKNILEVKDCVKEGVSEMDVEFIVLLWLNKLDSISLEFNSFLRG